MPKPPRKPKKPWRDKSKFRVIPGGAEGKGKTWRELRIIPGGKVAEHIRLAEMMKPVQAMLRKAVSQRSIGGHDAAAKSIFQAAKKIDETMEGQSRAYALKQCIDLIEMRADVRERDFTTAYVYSLILSMLGKHGEARKYRAFVESRAGSKGMRDIMEFLKE